MTAHTQKTLSLKSPPPPRGKTSTTGETGSGEELPVLITMTKTKVNDETKTVLEKVFCKQNKDYTKGTWSSCDTEKITHETSVIYLPSCHSKPECPSVEQNVDV